jgi:hypothetical protein
VPKHQKDHTVAFCGGGTSAGVFESDQSERRSIRDGQSLVKLPLRLACHEEYQDRDFRAEFGLRGTQRKPYLLARRLLDLAVADLAVTSILGWETILRVPAPASLPPGERTESQSLAPFSIPAERNPPRRKVRQAKPAKRCIGETYRKLNIKRRITLRACRAVGREFMVPRKTWPTNPSTITSMFLTECGWSTGS